MACELIHGNNIEAMQDMSAGGIDLTVTSPPYDDLRTYNDSSIWDFNVFKKVAEQLYRVTADGGVVVWNVNDATIKGGESGSSFRQALYFIDMGFLLHDTMLYQKQSAAYPAGKKSNRYSQVFEYCFILSKGKPKTANLIKDKTNKWAGVSTWGKPNGRNKEGVLIQQRQFEIAEFGYRENIWKLHNGKGKSKKNTHPAQMPFDLARDHIITWSNPNDVVLDPFMGSGTTGIAALELDRSFIGIEIDEEYFNISQDRIGIVV